MKLTLHAGDASYRIDSYSTRSVIINAQELTHSFIVTPERLLTDWPPHSWEALSPLHVETVIRLEPEVILLGTGQRLHFPKSEVLAAVTERGVGIEVMDTAAACRTYNVLMSEGRYVAAAIVIE